MTSAKPSKTDYSEAEAANVVGVSVEQLRLLIQKHVLNDTGRLASRVAMHFQPTDLLLLRFLAARRSTTQD